MDNSRVLLFGALAFVLLLLWQSWMDQYMPVEVNAGQTSIELSGQEQAQLDAIPSQQAAPVTQDGLPEVTASSEQPVQSEVGGLTNVQQSLGRIIVKTDVLYVEIDRLGGDVKVVDLPDYPISKNEPDLPVRLLTDEPSELFISQTGFLSSNGDAPNHLSKWASDSLEYTLSAGEETLEVPLTWANSEGMRVTKTYLFKRSSHNIEHKMEIVNGSNSVWEGRQYQQLQRKKSDDKNKPSFVYTYLGGVIYNMEDGYEKVDFGDMEDEDLSRDRPAGWSAMIQHYFLAAWVPSAEETNHFYTKTLSDARYVIGSYSQGYEVAPGESKVFKANLVVGPKLQHELEEIAPGLDLSVDYGKLTFLAKPVFWLLEKYHSLIGNWGWAIIFVTLSIKLIFFKLSEASYKSMAKMRVVQPRLKVLKERYGDDKQRLNQEMMAMYKKEKINPLGGCFPILIQIPVFISLYWVLVESVEMRQAPFMLWINDLSAADPYFILPVLMGITMLIQQRLNPTPLDPIQQKMMMALPVVFAVFFAFFPAGLVLYWVVNNSLSITQQWVITRRIEAASKAQ
ncbi:MAG: membrane protein insertase YidC [Gammaproteobacteria bacterium]|nr:MAG: membrane protein insertase YidC [Gammaproteobacteria bacterium]